MMWYCIGALQVLFSDPVLGTLSNFAWHDVQISQHEDEHSLTVDGQRQVKLVESKWKQLNIKGALMVGGVNVLDYRTPPNQGDDMCCVCLQRYLQYYHVSGTEDVWRR